MQAISYNLPDISLLEENNTSTHYIWHPNKTYIILGQSNKVETSVNLENATRDNVPILKRPSGGEAVILSPNTLVVAFTSKKEEYTRPLDFFKASNNKIISALNKVLGIEGLHQKGISDISYKDVKIAGSAIYRNREKLFYHCVINVNESNKTIERYLKHPKKEPDYRLGRSHSEFVTNLKKIGYPIEIANLKSKLADLLEGINQQSLI